MAGPMHEGKTVFSQVMELVPWRRFQMCVERYHGDSQVISLTTQEFFKIMAFAQITGRESLSNIVLCLNALSSQCYHLGIRSKITKSNLAHANVVISISCVCITFTNARHGLSLVVKRTRNTSESIPKKLTKAKGYCVIKKYD